MMTPQERFYKGPVAARCVTSQPVRYDTRLSFLPKSGGEYAAAAPRRVRSRNLTPGRDTVNEGVGRF
jgi:hypothetical protein